MDDIWQITKRIAADTFLSAQLIQVYITPERILQLIPRVGNHVIVLGDISDIDEKINKLRIFYSDGISRSGNWNDYKTIDLQFKNQIVCTKNKKMESEIVVGLDIGTTKIAVLVGRRTEHGK